MADFQDVTEEAGGELPVDGVDAGGLDADEDLARSDLGLRYLNEL